MYDLIIKNGTVIDGTGNRRQYADVAVKGSRVEYIAPVIDAEAVKEIDAEGRFVTPGFIDVHSHADMLAIIPNDSQNFLRQGITTQFMGQCGSSPAPFDPESNKKRQREMAPDEFEAFKKKLESPSSFMKAAENMQYSLNPAFLIGHKAMRVNAMGYGNGEPTDAQLNKMKSTLNEAMENGYFGFSTGLVYAPSVYAKTEELIELAHELTKYDGIYASHIRGEGNNVLPAVDEAIRIGREAGVRVLISHLKVLGDANKGKGAALIKKIDEANSAGQRVYADQYSHDGSSAELLSQFPPELLKDGRTAAIEKLKDEELRKELEYKIFNEIDKFEGSLCHAGYDRTIVSAADGVPAAVGKTIEQYAREQGKSCIDAYCDLIIESKGSAIGIYINQNIQDICTIMSHPYVFCGCDALDYHYKPEETFGGGHPRSQATFTRRLQIVRDYGLRSAEEAIRQMTGCPAEKLGFKDRGLLLPGKYADICIFDYENVRPTCDYLHPYRANEGIDYVIVNGQVVVDHDKMTGARPGMLIKR